MAFNLKLDGLEEALKKLEKMDDEIKADVDEAIEISVIAMHNKATNRAPVDNGRMKQFTRYYKDAPLTWILESVMPYAAYVNWGTITKLKVEKGWEQFAILFKGKGIRKTGGIRPTFFFTGPIEEEKPKMIENIKKVINK